VGRYWKRDLSVTLSGKGGSLTVENLKISFDGTKTLGSKQNQFTVDIWNLIPSHRKQLGDEFDKIEVRAGYKELNPGVIFSGNIRDVTNTLEEDGGLNVKSHLECGDGDKGFNQGAISKTFPAKTKPKDMVKAVLKTMPEIDAGPLRGLDDLPETKRPVSIFGWSFRQLDTFARQYGFYWSVQNGKAQTMKRDEALDDVIVLSKQTGVVGVPDQTDKGIKVKCLLNPRLLPGRQIDVRSDFLDENSGRGKQATDQGGGLFRVASVHLYGGNREDDFFCEVEGNRMQGKKVKK
jgi:hypothetical protein